MLTIDITLIIPLNQKYELPFTDLANLDALSDNTNILYGSPGRYGVVSGRKGVLLGINEIPHKRP